MNILITGIHGFVGSNLVKALKEEHTIYGLDLVSPETPGVKKTFGWAELENKKLPEVDVIIHLAGKAHDTKNLAKAKVYFDINLGLTQKIYDYFLSSSAGKFIFFSTVKAVADKVSGEMLKEEVVALPKGPYGESKLAAEQYILNKFTHPLVSGFRASNFKFETKNSEFRIPNPNTEVEGVNIRQTSNSEGKKVYVLRPCMIHGPGNKGNLNLLYQLVNKKIPWPLGAFENRRSFLSIDNLAYCIVRLLHEPVPSGVYHLADDEPVSTNELIGLIARSKGRKAKIWYLPKGFVMVIARMGGILHLPLNTERLQKLTESYVVSNKKIKQAVGIKNMPVTAYEGLTKTLKSFSID